MNDIYTTPQSELAERPAGSSYGSVETAQLGEYKLSIGDVLSEAWQRTKGAKGTVIVAIVVYLVVYAVLLGLAAAISAMISPSIGAVMQLAAGLVLAPMGAGLFMIGLKRAVDAPISFQLMFNYFAYLLPLIGAAILIYVLVLIGFLLLILPGIYLMVAYYMAIPLIVEKHMGVWQAMELSRKAITKRWFTVFGLGIVLGLLNMIAAIPMGIGLIWTIPMSLIAYGIVYRNMFGVETETQMA